LKLAFSITAYGAGNNPPANQAYLVLEEARNVIYRTMEDNTNGVHWVALYAFEMNKRELKWKFRNAVNMPVITDDDVYVCGFGKDLQTKMFYALDANTGKIKWPFEPANATENFSIYDPFVVTADLIFLRGVNKTIALSRTTHQIAWEINTRGEMMLGNSNLFIIEPNYSTWTLKMTAVALHS